MTLDVIEKVYEEKSKERERIRKKTLSDVQAALSQLRNEVNFDDAYIFGSVTSPNCFHDQSDIDLAFKGLDADKLFFTTAYLSRKLERDINIVNLEEIHFKEKILKTGTRWKKD